MMNTPKRVLAFDFGASSGRAILGIFENGQLRMEEVHRFTNDPVTVNGTLYWDVLRLFHEIQQGLLKAKEAGGFDSIGIDTWGVDFGLLDKDGNLLENPVHYRDSRTQGTVEKSFKKIPKNEFYNETGIQFMEINSVFQLFSLVQNRPELLERAETLLFMPDLFNYMLTGEKKTEATIASTSQMVNVHTKEWSDKVLDGLNIPKRILTPIVEPGTKVGKLSPEICDMLDLPPIDVISVAGHDTQSAAAAVPTQEDDFLFISCGTWSLFGTELTKPIVDENSYELNVTNEGGINGKTTFLKNIIGLWLIQESRRQYKREGRDYSYADLEKFALEAEPFKCFIDPDDPLFVAPGNLPERVREYCRKTNQPIPETVGEVMRCIYESLALKYRFAFSQIKDCTDKNYDVIHVVGGGAKDGLLCRMTSSSCNVKVTAGPVEATVLGNLAVQLIASGNIKNIKEARKMILDSEDIKTFLPENAEEWNEAYARFTEIIL